MNVLAAGSSTSVSLLAGYVLSVSGGYGTMQVAPPGPLSANGLRQVSPGGVSMGPFDSAVTVNLVATTAINYGVSKNGAADNVVPVTASFTVAATDDGKVFAFTTAATATIPAGLSPRPNFIVIPPPSGNASIAVSGGAQVNGATATLTRSRASNFAGVAVVPYSDSDGYGVNGA